MERAALIHRERKREREGGEPGRGELVCGLFSSPTAVLCVTFAGWFGNYLRAVAESDPGLSRRRRCPPRVPPDPLGTSP